MVRNESKSMAANNFRPTPIRMVWASLGSFRFLNVPVLFPNFDKRSVYGVAAIKVAIYVRVSTTY